ncbi:MAG: FkbM family methyltransferase [Leptothrix sp. (in: Bacteria)]|nr:FkbM family methyltransferase [Leptothrix sp. (in: b-proteobacteria)]
MNPLSGIRTSLLKAFGYEQIYALYKDAVTAYGWKKSAKVKACVDRDGQPIPWITYPAIDVLQDGIRPDLRVFEFGCGNSTLWWAKHVKTVHSVEHEQGWHQAIVQRMPAHVTLTYVALERGGAYCQQVRQAGPWHIVVVDGRDRVNCIKQSLEALSPDGVIVLDNSDRAEYQEGIELLKAQGFRQLRLRGMAPLITYISQTSIFYRDGNCLGL